MVEAFTLACPDPERSNLWKSSYIQLKFYSGSSGLALQRLPMSKQKRPLISFVIVGCMKSGTTSLYDHIMQHPMCRRGKQKEFHFFDWRWNQMKEVASNIHLETDPLAVQIRQALGIRSQDATDPLLQTFGQFFKPSMNDLSTNAKLTTGDGSPSYVMG